MERFICLILLTCLIFVLGHIGYVVQCIFFLSVLIWYTTGSLVLHFKNWPDAIPVFDFQHGLICSVQLHMASVKRKKKRLGAYSGQWSGAEWSAASKMLLKSATACLVCCSKKATQSCPVELSCKTRLKQIFVYFVETKEMVIEHLFPLWWLTLHEWTPPKQHIQTQAEDTGTAEPRRTGWATGHQHRCQMRGGRRQWDQVKEENISK